MKLFVFDTVVYSGMTYLVFADGKIMEGAAQMFFCKKADAFV
jgi:hypothetical protein